MKKLLIILAIITLVTEKIANIINSFFIHYYFFDVLDNTSLKIFCLQSLQSLANSLLLNILLDQIKLISLEQLIQLYFLIEL